MPWALRLSPDGERVAYTSHPVPRDDRGSVMLVDRSGEQRLLSGEWGSLTGIAWSPSGELRVRFQVPVMLMVVSRQWGVGGD